MTNLRVFTGSSNPALASKIAEYLGLPLGRAQVEKFPDSETSLKLHEDVRGRDVFIIQSTCDPVNHHLMELLVFIDCVRRASAQRITAVLPYFGYARQDRKDEGRVPITAKLVANLLTTAGANRVLTCDLHAAQIQGFFDIPVDNLSAEPVITTFFTSLDAGPIVLVSPDVGNIKRARVYAERLNGELAIIDKRRTSGSETIMQHMIGSVEGRTVLMVDDIIATAGTVRQAADVVRQYGAKRVIVAATHAVLAGPALERLAAESIEAVAVSDTIPLQPAAEEMTKLKVLTVSELLGEAIRRIHRNESVSSLFIQ